MLENQLNHNLTEKGNFFLESSRGGSKIESRCLNFALKNWSFTMFFSPFSFIFKILFFTPSATSTGSVLCLFSDKSLWQGGEN